MYSHEPPGYECPLCQTVRGEDCEDDWTKQSDVVYRDAHVTAFVTSQWLPNNAGHVCVIPNEHVENIYTLDAELAGRIHEVARRIAIGFMETYRCDGTSTRQHNGPAGNQEVWHYHLHVFPRYEGDGLYGARKRMTTPEERKPYAERLRAWLERG